MITVPFIFVSEDAKLENERLTVTNIFETYYFDKKRLFMEKSKVTIGLLGEKEDDGKELSVRITGKPFGKQSINFNIRYSHYRDNVISLISFSLDNFPIFDGETIFIEVYDGDKQLGKYPITFIPKKEKEG